MYFNNDFMPDAKVWIYQSDRKITQEESQAIQNELNQFTRTWQAHNHDLKAEGKVLLNHFIVIMVDESYHAPSGCSIDVSIHFVQNIERVFGLVLLDRLLLAYESPKGEVRVVHKHDVQAALKAGLINEDTPVYNNLIHTKKELEQNWKIPFRESWAGNLLKMA
jgi:chemotaxis regulatin CheY-phosphate phosphatase CheZ